MFLVNNLIGLFLLVKIRILYFGYKINRKYGKERGHWMNLTLAFLIYYLLKMKMNFFALDLITKYFCGELINKIVNYNINIILKMDIQIWYFKSV